MARVINQAIAGIRRLLPKKRFARSVSVLAGGTAAGQIVVIAASPILTRLYSPEEFGLLAVYAGLLGVLAVVASLRYQLAIPLPESDEEAASVVVLSLILVLGMSTVSAFTLAFFGTQITESLNTPALEPYLWLLPLGLLLLGFYKVFRYWAIRVRAFPAIARTKLTQALSMVGIQLGAYALGPVALLLGQVTGHAAGTSSLFALAVRGNRTAFRNIKIHDLWWAATRYRRFPIYSSWGAVFNKAGREAPAILFAALFSPVAAGMYLLANRILALPMALVGMAIADVFFSRASAAHRDGQLAPLVSSVHSKLAHFAMPPALILLLAAPELFEFIFGAQWGQAGEFAQWMAPFLYIQFVTSPLSTLFSVVEKQAQETLFSGMLLVVRIGAITVGSALQDVMVAVALFSLGSALCWMGILFFVLKSSGTNPIRVGLFSIGSSFVASALLVSPILLTLLWGGTGHLLVLASVLSAVFVLARYYLIFRAAF